MSLEKRLNQLKNKVGLVGGPLILNMVANSVHNISASIDPKDWHIELNITQGWSPGMIQTSEDGEYVLDKRTRDYLKQKNVNDALWVVGRDVVLHECGHWALPRGSNYGCPRSPKLHDIILDAVVQARTQKGRSRNQELEHYLANSFEDLLDNTFCKGLTTHTGQVLFYNDQGLTAENQKYGNYYEAFVKLNMFLWGDKHDNKLLERFYANDEKSIRAVQEVIEKLDLKQKAEINGTTYFDREMVVEKFVDESNWFEMAFDYTLVMDDLMDEQMPQQNLFGVGNPSSGQGKKQDKQGEGQQSSNGDKKQDGGSAFDKKLGGEQEKVIVSRFKEGKGKASYMDSFEYLDSLYRSLGREVPVKVDLFKKAHSFPVAHYGSQDFDPEVHDLARVKLSRIGVDEQGQVKFQTYRGDICIPAEYVKNLRGFPNLKIVNLDTSDSMREALFGSGVGMIVNPFAPEEQQWGVNSRYHHALVGKYGIDAYFEMQGIAGDVDSILINTSSSSIASERQTMGNRREENKLALSPQFGGTNMDCDILEESLSSESCFVLSLSDGEFQNWNSWYQTPEKNSDGEIIKEGVSVKDRFKEIVSQNAYAHIHLGSPNQFTADLQGWGVPVYFVNQDNPLEKLMVDITQKHYQKFALEAVKNA